MPKTSTTSKPTHLFAGVDNINFDNRIFRVTRNDLNNICHFFNIGTLQNYKQEKDVIVSHTNFFVFVKTTTGTYALKFFPPDTGKSITAEFAINRFLISRNFPTPPMHRGKNGRAYIPSSGRLATCFDFIKATPAWKRINQPSIIQEINSQILELKDILADAPGNIPRYPHALFTTEANTLAQLSKINAPYDQKLFIDKTLKEICQNYQNNRQLFKRQLLHNNTSLTNFLIVKGIAYTLDLSHIREDYCFADLASLIISCHFLGISRTIIVKIIKEYNRQHQIGPEYLPILNTLITLGLLKEYSKTIARENSLPQSASSLKLEKAYFFYLQDRKRTILRLLKK